MPRGIKGYRANRPTLLGKRDLGRKVRDEITGQWTYEDYLVEDAFGNKVDGRKRRALDNADCRRSEG